ncbi:MAG: type II and III secretion system protein, partial [Bdellovibrionaceae bacterium]|nr:type II and III secretion system protein [Pseudobdellovibrionaceae bacterium]
NFPVRVGADGFLNFLINGLNNTSYTYSLDNQSGLQNTFTMNGFPFLGDLDATLNLAETDGSVQVLSTTKILTKSGQSASITKNTPILILASRNTVLDAAASGQQNVTQVAPGTTNNQVGGAAGVAQETAQTQDITLSSNVTPVVTSSGSISIQVDLNLSTPGGDGGAFKTDRTAQTEVLTKDGQTVVVSGIYQKNETQRGDSIPWLRNIPILGWMFKTKNSNFAESEMLMFVTPNLVE